MADQIEDRTRQQSFHYLSHVHHVHISVFHSLSFPPVGTSMVYAKAGIALNCTEEQERGGYRTQTVSLYRGMQMLSVYVLCQRVERRKKPQKAPQLTSSSELQKKNHKKKERRKTRTSYKPWWM